MENTLLFIVGGLFIVQLTKGIALEQTLTPAHSYHEITNDEMIPAESIGNDQYTLINQCLLFSNNYNNHIFILSTDYCKDLLRRYRRRITHNALLYDPLYAEEPQYVFIDNSDTLLSKNKKKHLSSADEPFYIARGKRFSKNQQLFYDYYHPVNRIQLQPSFLMNFRQLRDNFYDDFNLSKNIDGKLKNNLLKFNYLTPRDKHSDILGLLQEPFFISRGKKSYGDDMKNEKHKLDDYDDSSLRGRRGEDFLEQLFKEKDPFYVTRGKKSDNYQSQ